MRLKIGEPTVRAALAGLAGQGLISAVPHGAASSQVRLTPAGATAFTRYKTASDRLPRRRYGGLPAEGLTTAHRVFATVTERANAVLAD
jgi:hypothetical protein